MTPVLLRKRLVSFKAEIAVVLGVMVALLLLPGFAVASLTNVKALIGGGDDGGYADNAMLYTGDSPADNTYEWGNCTYWVFIMRQKDGHTIPNTWGNAATWAFYAQLQGYTVDQTPSSGAIMQTANSAGGLGHVAYVTDVNPANGDWTISEMNVKGLNIVSTRTLTAADARNFNFIHDKKP